ncbi:hypothetical protein [Desulfovibrio sp. ZJ369]|uniref:hypothetical protein n=1 Tax=Desulfovibrio sp. ZJ369 TaxID=2709793 RepID=UPI0013EADB84|nr:hypothetical protein [Desulfovibrio sp. ZJ369]
MMISLADSQLMELLAAHFSQQVTMSRIFYSREDSKDTVGASLRRMRITPNTGK